MVQFGRMVLAIAIGDWQIDFINIVEKSVKPEVLFLGDWIVLVGVAVGATHGQSEPNGAQCIGAINGAFDAIFFNVDASFGIK